MTTESRRIDEGQSTGGDDHNDSEKTVLVVDDDQSVRNVIRAFLDRAGGWTVLEAPNGQAALDKLDETVDVLLLDRDMPTVSGPEVVAQLDDTTFTGPVVVLSCTPPDSTLGENDVSTYLTKPADFETVVEKLDRALRN